MHEFCGQVGLEELTNGLGCQRGGSRSGRCGLSLMLDRKHAPDEARQVHRGCGSGSGPAPYQAW